MPIVSLSVPHFRQEQRGSCLAACVRMALAHYGHTCSEDELRRLLATGPLGTRAGNVLRVASLGFDAQLKTSSVADLGAALIAGIPPIVLLDTGPLDYWSVDCPHVAIVVGLDLAMVYLNDPAFDTAPQQASLTGFDRAWAANHYHAAFIRRRP